MATPNSEEQKNTPATEQQDKPQAGSTPHTTQSDLTDDDGAGIRGGYGDSDQTNGLEGGQESGPDGSPEENS